jgi:hypothetical protein
LAAQYAPVAQGLPGQSPAHESAVELQPNGVQLTFCAVGHDPVPLHDAATVATLLAHAAARHGIVESG